MVSINWAARRRICQLPRTGTCDSSALTRCLPRHRGRLWVAGPTSGPAVGGVGRRTRAGGMPRLEEGRGGQWHGQVIRTAEGNENLNRRRANGQNAAGLLVTRRISRNGTLGRGLDSGSADGSGHDEGTREIIKSPSLQTAPCAAGGSSVIVTTSCHSILQRSAQACLATHRVADDSFLPGYGDHDDSVRSLHLHGRSAT
jgi:hypothetical protein